MRSSTGRSARNGGEAGGVERTEESSGQNILTNCVVCPQFPTITKPCHWSLS